ncbi:signal transduction histidine kinase [Catalinimonas alkaloidigena]|uniref:sensor histidine kinase n=1 Tax=Catalinimonas alkaloidigena TaxID=1075417 RepID=UPI0024076C59|nr:ATP-binding protein [Catalinimonas alkaloidigena]MDF9798492.1 signal transduction histidine kinase [Catalinimonas alkaloidigena]
MKKRVYSKEKVDNIYQKKNTVKIVVLIFATLIAGGSVYYTNSLVEELKERERSFINLYAETLEMVANSEGDDIPFLFQQVIVPNNSIPVILTDSYGNYIEGRNLGLKDSYSEEKRARIIEEQLEEMRALYDHIEIVLTNPTTGMVDGYQFVYYKNSFLLTQLQYYPYVQLSVIAVFALLTYTVFSYSRRAEQNRVWIGMAKETAHQLGTPLSSLMAWLEFFRSDPDRYDPAIIKELDKDIQRLEMITSRFSSIGSVPTLKKENITSTIKGTIHYLEKRISTKVKMQVQSTSDDIDVLMNRPLFEWVIENICKNAVDAMSGVGSINIEIRQEKNKAIIDIADTGKGIQKSKVNQVFTPGYTTKKRGWGLGLSLAQRIIENYHRGKIFVKESEVDVGTTFRIILHTEKRSVNGEKTQNRPELMKEH